MAKPNSFKAVVEALEVCIAAAPDNEKDALAQALHDFAKTYHESYRRMVGDGAAPAMISLLRAIEDGSETFIDIE
jgi:hypothetical protein